MKAADRATLEGCPVLFFQGLSATAPEDENIYCTFLHVPRKLRLKKTGRKADKDGFLEIFSDRCGIHNLHPHKLRHTFASIAITNGADAASVSETLGHSDKAVTLRMYTHADEESKKRAAAIVWNAINE